MSLIKLLASPELVAEFQKVCGLRYAESIGGKNGDNILISSKVLHEIIKFGSSLAGENFFSLFIASHSWWFDLYIGRKVSMGIAFAMFLGQSAKDTLKIPRPASPPAVKLETAYETEYGTPSTHTIIGSMFASSFVLFASDVYRIPRKLGIVFPLLYSSYVGISRVYVGVHSFLDVMSGAMLSNVICFSFSDAMLRLDRWLIARRYNTILYCGLLYGMAWSLYRLDDEIDPATGRQRWNTGKGDAARVLSVHAGFLCGSHYLIDNGIQMETLGLIPKNAESLKKMVKRIGVGIIIALTVKKISSIICKKIFTLGMKKTQEENERDAELPIKFFSTFATVSLSIIIVPLLLQE